MDLLGGNDYLVSGVGQLRARHAASVSAISSTRGVRMFIDDEEANRRVCHEGELPTQMSIKRSEFNGDASLLLGLNRYDHWLHFRLLRGQLLNICVHLDMDGIY